MLLDVLDIDKLWKNLKFIMRLCFLVISVQKSHNLWRFLGNVLPTRWNPSPFLLSTFASSCTVGVSTVTLILNFFPWIIPFFLQNQQNNSLSLDNQVNPLSNIEIPYLTNSVEVWNEKSLQNTSELLISVSSLFLWLLTLVIYVKRIGNHDKPTKYNFLLENNCISSMKT